jgi:hypothetical protein
MLGLFLIAVILLATRRAPAERLPPVTILSEPYIIPVTPRDRFALTFPNSRFVARLENAFFGPRKPINIKTKVFSLSNDQGSNFNSSKTLSLGEPTFSNATGLQIWFLGRAAFEQASHTLASTPEIDVRQYPSVFTAEGITSSVFIGQSIVVNGAKNDVGLLAQYVGSARDELTDLVAMIQQSEIQINQPSITNNLATNSVSILTNLNIRARLEIPKGHGVMLIQSSQNISSQKLFGVLIDPL